MRDAALLASGKCAASFPQQCRASLPELYKLWTAHLDDNIPSVRADAAAALGDAVQAYKQELLEELLPLIRQGPLCLCMAWQGRRFEGFEGAQTCKLETTGTSCEGFRELTLVPYLPTHLIQLRCLGIAGSSLIAGELSAQVCEHAVTVTF